MTPSSAQPFAFAGRTWRCWIVTGQHGQRYEWRTEDGRLQAGRHPEDMRRFWAAARGRPCGSHYISLVSAMSAAIAADARMS